MGTWGTRYAKAKGNGLQLVYLAWSHKQRQVNQLQLLTLFSLCIIIIFYNQGVVKATTHPATPFCGWVVDSHSKLLQGNVYSRSKRIFLLLGVLLLTDRRSNSLLTDISPSYIHPSPHTHYPKKVYFFAPSSPLRSERSN